MDLRVKPWGYAEFRERFSLIIQDDLVKGPVRHQQLCGGQGSAIRHDVCSFCCSDQPIVTTAFEATDLSAASASFNAISPSLMEGVGAILFSILSMKAVISAA